MPDTPTPLKPLGYRDGVAMMVPSGFGIMPFGLLLGAMTAQLGISFTECFVMSALIFGGSAQYLAISNWSDPLPVLAIVIGGLLVSLRFILMGLSLARAFRGRPRWLTALAAFFMVDAAWALALRPIEERRFTLPCYAGLTSTLYVFWVGSVLLGHQFGKLVDDPLRYGLDFGTVSVFIALFPKLYRSRSTILEWAAAAVTGIVVERFWPHGPWYVVAGGLAALCCSLIRTGRQSTGQQA